jgi:cell shape-determining protein MreC
MKNELDNIIDKKSSAQKCNITNLPPKQFALISTVIGLALSDNLSIDEKNALGNFIVSIGQSILTEVAQESFLQSNNSDDKVENEIDELKKELAQLKKRLDKTE